MSDSPIDPLPQEIATLLGREKLAYPEDPVAKAAMRDRIELAAAVSGGPEAGNAGSATDGSGGRPGETAAHGSAGAGGVQSQGLAGARRLLAVVGMATFVAGGALGGAVATIASRASHGPQPDRPAVTSLSPPSVREEPASAVPSAMPSRSSAPLDARADPGPLAGSDAMPSRATETRGNLVRERELLDAAHAALARGRPEDAIAAASRHAQKWPNGYLVEDRDAVWIEALAAAGQRAEAERRAAAFRKAFPKSLFIPIVDAALSSP